MSRRAQAEILVYVFRVILIAILAMLLAVQIGFYTRTTIPTTDLEAELIAQRILFGPDGLELREEKTGKAMPGTLDLAKLQSGRALTDIYDEGFGDENLWGGKVSLYTSRDEMSGGKPFAASYLGPDTTATKLLELAKTGARGSGSGVYYSSTYPVQYRRPGMEPELGFLKIELVRRI